VSPSPTGTRRRGFGVVRIAGRSMEPTLRSGDLVLVRWGAAVRPGQLAVFAHPVEGVLVVKRVGFPDPDDATRWWLERDNPGHGSDSWSFGSISREAILARALTRLPRRRTRE